MGKKSVIKSLWNVLGNIITHKILERYTNKPESLHHLKSEIIAYSDNASDLAKQFNWNDSEVEEIKLGTLSNFERNMKKYYPDVKFPIQEAEQLISETIDEIIS